MSSKDNAIGIDCDSAQQTKNPLHAAHVEGFFTALCKGFLHIEGFTLR